MSPVSCEIGMGIMSYRSHNSIGKFVNQVSKYSLVYYVIVTLILLFTQLDIFKENVPIEFVVNLVIVISSFTIATNVVDKMLRRNKQDSKPFLYCPECSDAKMRTVGKWVCERCQKEFLDPKKEPNS